MAALDFPLVPTTDSEVTTGDITWKWNGYAWYSTTDATQIISVGPTPPDPAREGQMWWADVDVDDGGGRLYIYTGDEWVDTSLPGGGFSGDYNDLINKPNIPPEFNLDDGSVENDIIHWAELGSVQEISTTETGSVNNGQAYTNCTTTTGGSGSGLTCNVIRRKTTGAYEIYVANRGQGYNVGETVAVDLGNGNSVNATIDKVNDTVNGWVARPGEAYYVSSNADSLNTGKPQFMLGTILGGDLNSFNNVGGGAATNLFPIGDKSICEQHYYGNQHQNAYYMAGDSPHTQTNVNNSREAGGDTFTQVRQTDESWIFSDWNGPSNGKSLILQIGRDSSNKGELILYRDYATNAANYIKFEATLITSNVSSNSALSFQSKNGKYTYRNSSGDINYTINADTGSASFILPEDSANPANYDADGEYTGPVQDRVADLIARVSAIESNEVADDAVDSALLTLVASLSQRLDERDVQIAALTSRIAALEGA